METIETRLLQITHAINPVLHDHSFISSMLCDLEELSQRIVVYKYELNLLIRKGVMVNIKYFCQLELKVVMCQWESLVQSGFTFKYEVNQFSNKEVMDNVKVLGRNG